MTHAPVTTATRRVYTVPVRWLVVSRSSSPTSSMAPALCLRKTPAVPTMRDSPRQRNAAPLDQRPNDSTVHAEPQGPEPLRARKAKTVSAEELRPLLADC